MTRVKVCGITRLDDALDAVAAGADALGFVFADSPRRIGPDEAAGIIGSLPPLVLTVAVFRDATEDEVRSVRERTGVDVLQFHGEESRDYCARFGPRVVKRFPVSDDDTVETVRERTRGWQVAARLLDPGAGDGRTFPWELGRAVEPPCILAGGLDPDNVAEAVRRARPYAVDASSALECAPGRKDAARVRAFVEAVRREDARHASR